MFREDARLIFDSLATSDKNLDEIAGDHSGFPLGGALAGKDAWGRDAAVDAVVAWLRNKGD